MEHMLSLAVLAIALLMGKPWRAMGMGDLSILMADGFFIGGILIISVGALRFVWEKGGFDMLGYTFSNVIKREKGESYYSYITDKRAAKKWLSPMRDGAVMIGFSVIFAILWCFFAG